MDEEELGYALEDAAEGSIPTDYPWTEEMLAVLERVARNHEVTEADRTELIRLVDEKQVEDDIEDANSDV